MNILRIAVVAWACFAAVPADAAWTWTTLDFPGSSQTTARGICGASIVGDYYNGRGCGFLYDGSTWSTIGPSWATAIAVSGNRIVGTYTIYEDLGGGWVLMRIQPFIYDGSNYADINLPGTPADIDGDTIVGTIHQLGGEQGFLYTEGTSAQMRFPGSYSTRFNGVSGSKIVGVYDLAGAYNDDLGFVYDGRMWTSLQFPSGTLTRPYGVEGNNIVGSYYDGSRTRGFLYDSSGWTGFDFPGAVSTTARGISGDMIVGTYRDADGYDHSFILTIPEPTALALLAMAGVLLVRRRA